MSIFRRHKVYIESALYSVFFLSGDLLLLSCTVNDSTSSAALIPATKKEPSVLVIGLPTNVNQLALLSTVHSGR